MYSIVAILGVVVLTVTSIFFIGNEDLYITTGIILSAAIIIAIILYLRNQTKNSQDANLPDTKYTYDSHNK